MTVTEKSFLLEILRRECNGVKHQTHESGSIISIDVEVIEETSNTGVVTVDFCFDLEGNFTSMRVW